VEEAMIRILKIRFLVAKNLLFLMVFFSLSLFLASFQAVASQYYIGGHLGAWPERGEQKKDDWPPEPRLKLEESLSSVGPTGNYAEAIFRADLTTGYVGNYTYAVNGNETPYWWLIASAEALIYWRDTLYFTIPPGSYPTGLSMTVAGSLNGVLYTSGDNCAQAGQSWDVVIGRVDGGPESRFSGVERISGDDSISISESFSLTLALVNEGTTLEKDTVVAVKVRAGLGESAVTSSAANNHTMDNEACVDFYHTIKIHSLVVPEGIDWTSASGVFLLGCEGDFNDDADVDESDLALFAADFGRTNCDTGADCEGDFENDDDVDSSDLVVFAADFGRTDCP
jgi:hypothetical protein